MIHTHDERPSTYREHHDSYIITINVVLTLCAYTLIVQCIISLISKLILKFLITLM